MMLCAERVGQYILKEVRVEEDENVFITGGRNIHNLFYAADDNLIAENWDFEEAG